jgi:hypothetical protein
MAKPAALFRCCNATPPNVQRDLNPVTATEPLKTPVDSENDIDSLLVPASVTLFFVLQTNAFVTAPLKFPPLNVAIPSAKFNGRFTSPVGLV